MKTFLSWVKLHQGNLNSGRQISDEALQLAEESGDIYSKSIAMISRGYSLICKGYFGDAEKFLLKGNELCEKMNIFEWNALAQQNLAETYFQIHEYEKAKDCYVKGIEYLKQAGIGQSRSNFFRLGIARATVMGKEMEFELESIFEYVEQNILNELAGQMRKYIAEILLNIGDQYLAEAEDWAKKAIIVDEQNSMRFRLGQDYGLYAEIFRQEGDRSKAKDNLEKAIEIFKECGADGWVEKYEKEFAEL